MNKFILEKKSFVPEPEEIRRDVSSPVTVGLCLRAYDIYKRKPNEYWKRKVHEKSGDPKRLWKTSDSVLGRGRPRPLSGFGGISAGGFSKAFANKVDRIRRKTESAPYPDFSENHCDLIFDSFSEITADDVRRLIGQAKDKTCNSGPCSYMDCKGVC